jgi:hypothetical protein
MEHVNFETMFLAWDTLTRTQFTRTTHLRAHIHTLFTRRFTCPSRLLSVLLVLVPFQLLKTVISATVRVRSSCIDMSLFLSLLGTSFAYRNNKVSYLLGLS